MAMYTYHTPVYYCPKANRFFFSYYKAPFTSIYLDTLEG